MLGELNSIDFICTTSYCVARGSSQVAATLKELQTGLNKFASQLGFVPLRVDGQIGNLTLLAAKKVAPHLATYKSVPRDGFFAQTASTIRVLTMNADVWVLALKSLSTTTPPVPSAGPRAEPSRHDLPLMTTASQAADAIIDQSSGSVNQSGTGPLPQPSKTRTGLIVAAVFVVGIGAYIWQRKTRIS